MSWQLATAMARYYAFLIQLAKDQILNTKITLTPGLPQMRFAVRFAHTKENFRLSELSALVQLFACTIRVLELTSDTPYALLDAPDIHTIELLLSRSVLIKEVIELWASAHTLDDIHTQVRQLSPKTVAPYQQLSFKFIVDTFGGAASAEQQLALINSFDYMPLHGTVKMNRPDTVFALYINQLTSRFFFGRLVGTGQRALIEKFTLKKRLYLGSTSMDAELSLLMANLGLVTRGTLVYDPFVGTASLLCTASHFGAYTIGSDIDGRQMRGCAETGQSMYANIDQYRVQQRVLGGVVCDTRQHPWHDRLLLDAIITDPPYGVRAGAKKTGTTTDRLQLLPSERVDRYPKTVPYELHELVADLFDLAARFLRPHGRLVFWYPTEREQADNVVLPSDDRFTRLETVPQYLKEINRWLMVFARK